VIKLFDTRIGIFAGSDYVPLLWQIFGMNTDARSVCGILTLFYFHLPINELVVLVVLLLRHICTVSKHCNICTQKPRFNFQYATVRD